MQRGLRNAKTPKQVRNERKCSGKDLAVATARIIGRYCTGGGNQPCHEEAVRKR